MVGRPQPPGEHAAVARAGEQRAEPPPRARARDRRRRAQTGRRPSGARCACTRCGTRARNPGVRRARRCWPRRPGTAPARSAATGTRSSSPATQREPEQQEVERGNRRHQARTNAAERLPGVLVDEEQLIDAEIPADDMLGQAQRSQHGDDGRQQLADASSDSAGHLMPSAPQQPQRTAAQHQRDCGVRLDDHLPRDHALQHRDAERPAGQAEQPDGDRQKAGEGHEAIQARHDVRVRRREFGLSGRRGNRTGRRHNADHVAGVVAMDRSVVEHGGHVPVRDGEAPAADRARIPREAPRDKAHEPLRPR